MKIHPLNCGLGFAYLVETPGGLFLVDSGSPGQEKKVLAKMKALERTDLKLIWITHAHYDHYGSAAALRRLTGAVIGVHLADAPSLAAGQSPLGTGRGRGVILAWLMPLISQLRPLPPTPPDFTLEDGGTLERFGMKASILHTPGHTPGHTCLLLSDGTVFSGDLLGSAPRVQLQNLLACNWRQLPVSLARLQAARPAWVYTGHSSRPVSGERLQKLLP